MNDILRITEPLLSDDSIDRYEHIEYNPVVGANLNSGDIRINIETQDIFTHPCESFLLIEDQLLKNDDTLYANGNAITITNNGIIYIFKNIKYQLSRQEIESILNPGQATTMLGLLKYPDDFSKSQGLNQLWYKDTNPEASIANNTCFNVRQDYIIRTPNPKGSFSFRIPLKHIFGFCGDYNKILYGMKQTLTLTRDNDNNAIFRANGVDVGKIRLDKISWYMPHVMPADQDKMELYKIIEKKEKLPVGYRMIQCDSAPVPQTTSFTWRLAVKSSPEVPRFIIVGFQTDKNNNQETNPAVFNHVGVKNIYVTLNSTRYPEVDYEISFDKFQFSRVYGDAALFRSKFFNMDELVSNPNITPADYKSLYPLFLFDVSKQSERLKYYVTDIQIKAFFENNVPGNTEAYAFIISARLINFQSDGNKFSVVF